MLSCIIYAESWTGTGWALKDGYIVTNFHCVDGAEEIVVRGHLDYNAKVVAIDKVNDLAIIRITDEAFKGFGEIPYSIERKQCEVGETVWTLGYPMMDIMGEDVKFTDGKISSKTGYQGELQTYQITVPIQPGNSGGALFNQYGKVVGITSSGLKKTIADNVNYAIKTNYLTNLIESKLSLDILPTGSVANLPLTEQIKRISKFIFPLYFKSNTSSSSSFISSESTPIVFPSEATKVGDLYYKAGKDSASVEVARNNDCRLYYLSIPSSITYKGKEYRVTSIGTSAFAGNTNINTVIIPNSITEIKGRAFLGCKYLQHLTISNSVVNISSHAFFACDDILSIDVAEDNPKYDSRCGNAIIETHTNTLIVAGRYTIIPNTVTSIGKNAFRGRRLTSITIPNSVTSIENSAFADCKNLTSISIPNSVTSIGQYAFSGCSSLYSIILPNGLELIDHGVFNECTFLSVIVIPNTVREIRWNAFEDCPNIQKIYIQKGTWSKFYQMEGLEGYKRAIKEKRLKY
jgi:hypothetical protein